VPDCACVVWLRDKVFFYRYHARDGALREIRLGEVGPQLLSRAGRLPDDFMCPTLGVRLAAEVDGLS